MSNVKVNQCDVERGEKEQEREKGKGEGKGTGKRKRKGEGKSCTCEREGGRRGPSPVWQLSGNKMRH
jgi:hypothetical protein